MTRFPAPHPLLCGILNVTPDSFSDGGRFVDAAVAAEHGRRMVDEGAAIIDVGGESTRPGAASVPAEEQIRRVIPAIRALAALRRGGDPPWRISIDTTSAEVAARALDEGASMVNDVSAGRDDPAMLPLAARAGAGVILMHRRTMPAGDRYSDRYETTPAYDDVVRDVGAFLATRVTAAREAGLAAEEIVIDPGFGFGKSVEQNMEMLARLEAFLAVHPLVMVGVSRKSFLGAIGGRAQSATAESAAGAPSRPPSAAATPADRLPASLAAAVLAALRGAALLRVHDVAATRQALAVVRALRQCMPTASGNGPMHP